MDLLALFQVMNEGTINILGMLRVFVEALYTKLTEDNRALFRDVQAGC